jgi:hypothetical protein
MARLKLLSLLVAVTAAAGFTLAFLGAHGCASNCQSGCPGTTVYIGSNDSYEFNTILTDVEVMGPACPPPYGIGCAGIPGRTSCSYVPVTAPQPGWCDVLLVFSDRPSEIVHLQFGEPVNANGSCCKGYPPIGPSVYTIPDKPTGPIYSGGGDAGPPTSDAVTVLTDAAVATDAARDAGTDSLR